MKTYVNKANIFWIIGILFLILPTIAKAASDDDDECLLCDVVMGVAIVTCESFAACRAVMLLVGGIVLVISAMTCLCGGPKKRRDMWDSTPSYRRVGATAVGYGLGRAFIG